MSKYPAAVWRQLWPAAFAASRRLAGQAARSWRPRDYDARACYVIYYPGSYRVEFRRVTYDIKKAQEAHPSKKETTILSLAAPRLLFSSAIFPPHPLSIG